MMQTLIAGSVIVLGGSAVIGSLVGSGIFAALAVAAKNLKVFGYFDWDIIATSDKLLLQTTDINGVLNIAPIMPNDYLSQEAYNQSHAILQNLLVATDGKINGSILFVAKAQAIAMGIVCPWALILFLLVAGCAAATGPQKIALMAIASLLVIGGAIACGIGAALMYVYSHMEGVNGLDGVLKIVDNSIMYDGLSGVHLDSGIAEVIYKLETVLPSNFEDGSYEACYAIIEDLTVATDGISVETLSSGAIIMTLFSALAVLGGIIAIGAGVLNSNGLDPL